MVKIELSFITQIFPQYLFIKIYRRMILYIAFFEWNFVKIHVLTNLEYICGPYLLFNTRLTPESSCCRLKKY